MPQPKHGRDDILQLQSHEILLWTTAVGNYRARTTSLIELLTETEVTRANRYVFERDRLSFVVGRANLRILLGRYLSTPPKEIPITQNRFGKPRLNLGRLHFNVSHSGEWVFIALCHGHEIGIDIEEIRPLQDSNQLASQFFSPLEFRELQTVPQSDRLAAFFACWTRKEAYVKARGKGLSVPLESFDVPTAPDGVIRWQAVHTHDASPWFVQSLATPNNYVGAIAAPVANLQVRRLTT